jgi:hypothetical protein
MPGAPLPEFALFIMQARTAWIIISFVPPIMAILAAFFARDDRRALVIFSLLIVLIFIQANLTLMTLFYFVFQWPFVGIATPPLDQTSTLFNALTAHGLSSWGGSLLGIIALAISIFFFWRFIRKEPRAISN